MRDYFLTSKRLGFSVWSMDDFDLAKSLWGDPDVTKLIGGVYSDEMITARLKREILTQRDHQVQYWPIFELPTDDFIGVCGLTPYNLENGIYELGFHLKKKFWGKGIASEAGRAAIEYGHQRLGISHFFAGHNPKNTASGKVLFKLGFSYTHDEFYPPTGLNHPSYYLTKLD